MADFSGKTIGAPDFNPEKCKNCLNIIAFTYYNNCLSVDVKELSQRCVGGMELVNQRQKMQTLSEETNMQLKKNVYQNYMQFIETAKEISRKIRRFVKLKL